MYENKQVDSIASRLRIAMDLHHKKQADIIKATGINSGALSSYLSGRYEPKQLTIYKLAAYLNVSEAWLMGYDVPMERVSQPSDSSPSRLSPTAKTGNGTFPVTGETAPARPSALALADDGNYDPELLEAIRRKRHPSVAHRQVPILGTVPYSASADGKKSVLGQVDLNAEMSADGQSYFALIVSGDMMYPEYMDGDIIIVRKQNTAKTGNDVIAHIKGQATLKRLIKSESSITLRPLNPAYETDTYTNEEAVALPIRIAGIVVEQRRNRK